MNWKILASIFGGAVAGGGSVYYYGKRKAQKQKFAEDIAETVYNKMKADQASAEEIEKVEGLVASILKKMRTGK